MSDEADSAQDHMEREEVLRRKYQPAARLEVEPTGECLNCFEPVPVSHRWCNAECRRDWEKWSKR